MVIAAGKGRSAELLLPASKAPLRRGKIPGVALGLLAGGVTYISLYEPLTETPDFSIEWPFSNLTEKLGDWTGSGSGDKKKD